MTDRTKPWLNRGEPTKGGIDETVSSLLSPAATNDDGTVVLHDGTTIADRRVWEVLLTAVGEDYAPGARHLVIWARKEMARRYESGDGVVADQNQALLWLYAASLECAEAAYRLATSYEKGERNECTLRFLLCAVRPEQKVTSGQVVDEAVAAAHLELGIGLHLRHRRDLESLRKIDAFAGMGVSELEKAAVTHCREGLRRVDGLANTPSNDLIEEARKIVKGATSESHSVIVLHGIGGMPSREDQQIKRYSAKVGVPLPLIRVPAPTPIVRQLKREFPHLAPLFDEVGRMLAGARYLSSDILRLRPLLLVGPPGSGKTFAAIRMAELFGVAYSVVAAGGLSDNRSLHGTSRGWGTGQPSSVVQFVVDNEIANPLIIVDEIDKAGNSRHNGRASDTLLQLLDPGNAERFHDDYLQGRCDLSHVNWILTANNLNAIDAPLRSRVIIVNVPKPALKDIISSVVYHTRRKLAERHRVAPELLPALMQTDIDAIIAQKPRDARDVVRYVERALEILLEHEFKTRTIN